MTSYLVRYDQSGSFTGLCITPGTWPIRLAALTGWGYTSGGITFFLERYDGGVASGGSVVPVVALRQGAPAATATARLGNLTFTGTLRLINGAYLPPGSSSGGGSPPVTIYSGATVNMDLPLPVIIAPGNVLNIDASPSFNVGCGCEIYFEELRLSGSY